MTFDPKIRSGVPSAVRPAAAKPQQPKGKPAPKAAGHVDASSFDGSSTRRPKLAAGVGDLAAGRAKRGGVADDSVGLGDVAAGRAKLGGVADDSVGLGDLAAGRKKLGGVADDSVGLGDLAAGRKKLGGVADDSVGNGDAAIGRTPRGGVADDSVGTAPAWAGLVGPDTNPVTIKQREAAFDRLETPGYIADGEVLRAGDLSHIATELPQALGGSAGKQLLAQAKGDAAVAARLDATVTATRKLRPDVRASLLNTFAAAPSGAGAAVVQHVAQSPAFQQMSGADQAALASVLARTGERGQEIVGVMLEKYPEVLRDRDANGSTLLSDLAQLAGQPLNSKLYGKTTTDEVLSNVLVDIANPNRVQQGTAPTCTVTSMQFELVADEPAEYARLMAGLAGPQGKATMRSGGDLELGAEDGDQRARDDRSVSQAIFQSAAMEYANGKGATFDPIAGTSTNTATGQSYAGLKPSQQTAILRQLFGVKYTTDTLYNEQEGAKALDALRGWDAQAHPNRPILLDIDQGKVNHAVTLERIAGGQVYFRDPYGVLRKMDEAKFPQVVVAIHKPVTA